MTLLRVVLGMAGWREAALAHLLFDLVLLLCYLRLAWRMSGIAARASGAVERAIQANQKVDTLRSLQAVQPQGNSEPTFVRSPT